MQTISQTNPRKPDWLKIQLRVGKNYSDLKEIVSHGNLHTVCQEALCPNIYECWDRRAATLMILGDVCTRSCGFCNVKTGRPTWHDPDEPQRTAEAVRQMGLKHCVITSVNRDELLDGGAAIWAETIRAIHELNPDCTLEVLIPDFKGDEIPLKTICDANPEILGHNIETVPRLYSAVRPQADYLQSLDVLKRSKKFGMRTKTAMMVGLGEMKGEVIETIKKVAETGCDILAIGQYLQPTRDHHAVDRYVHPSEFDFYREEGLKQGLKWVESGPLVRSSYHADAQASALIEKV
ncbi:MAG TPA: lipoyl synthase [Candidatus Marinimicrobia bacterium]|nr:lipoyl synthase [Candidatus Neomarinimicrobiota bacterium]HIA86047.1 lipoyl synthase [Candidatus Neomarinimicrobiota bacterium]